MPHAAFMPCKLTRFQRLGHVYRVAALYCLRYTGLTGMRHVTHHQTCCLHRSVSSVVRICRGLPFVSPLAQSYCETSSQRACRSESALLGGTQHMHCPYDRLGRQRNSHAKHEAS